MSAPSVAFVLLCFGLFTVTTVVLFMKTNEVVKQPYMDEIFHVPQAQHYCQGHFHKWDPMITTLPGLYVVTSGLYKPITWMLQLEPLALCTTFSLRAINLLFALGNLYLVYKISRKLHDSETESGMMMKTALESFTLTSFPVLYFCTFLYYTDPGAVFFVLLMYVFHLYDSNVAAAVVGAMSVVFRQTNIIWVVFMAGLVLGKNLTTQLQLEKKDAKAEMISDLAVLKLTWKVIVYPALTSPIRMFTFIFSVVMDLWMFLAVGIAFIVFIYINEGLVVGDRTHHQACLHLPQLFYFLSFATCFAFPFLVSIHKLFDFVISTAKRPLPMILFSGVAWFWVYKFTYVHEYLLADNRHYTFYLWSRIYRRYEFVKYALIPAYYYAFVAFNQSIKSKNVFWKIAFLVCLMFATVPQKLLEFRYFIIPYIIFRLNMPSQPLFKILLEMSFYTLVNGMTLYMYMYKPFKWETEEGWQRFLW